MNANDREWNELWDNEPEDEDEDYELGSDIDANNDETFGNAAEWNEDEHEELIARDSILSHTPQSNLARHHQTINNNNNTINTNNNHLDNRNIVILTVDELERQLFNASSLQIQPPGPSVHGAPGINRAGWSPFGGTDLFQDLRDGKEDDISIAQRNHRRNNHRSNKDRDNRHHREHRDNHEYREHRDRREHRHHRHRFTIIPPQVQLSVLQKAKRSYSITAMHPDEFIQDRLPTSDKGFQFLRHSTVSRIKPKHDGVLTEKERNWPTKIQEKIQADYDGDIDQDYYYLLYFNRIPMMDEATQKPCGPGILDRRFIPRERLLYNSAT